jgi:hypothetical protein
MLTDLALGPFDEKDTARLAEACAAVRSRTRSAAAGRVTGGFPCTS